LEVLGLKALDRQRVFSDQDPDAPTSPALRRRLAAAGTFQGNTPPSRSLVCLKCPSKLGAENGDSMEQGLCKPCKARWDMSNPRSVQAASPPKPERSVKVRTADLSGLEKSMISRVYGLMPTSQLLELLNTRRVAEAGPDAVLLTADAIRDEIGKVSASPVSGELDYPSLRKLLNQAKKDGTLALVTEQVINDFAVIFSLSAKQVMGLKDVLLSTEDE
jgi:hypothetical protein